MSQHNYLQAYDAAIAGLTASPESLVLQYQAVLALVRAGALDFAWAEYARYELGDVTALPDNKLLEDIMALKGRLLKDMALRTDGDMRTEIARQSADAYARAYKKTGGYFSGINVASMSLLSGEKDTEISAKANAILDLLPNEKTGSKEDTYYIEATRAEALLLMGHKNNAGDIFQDALMHDPLNYTAHATTLKQFRMIMNARQQDLRWLAPFAVPSAAHFAGHLFSNDKAAQNYLEKSVQKDLCKTISDEIQRHDIGFGYGALAAGADILIAETLLDEGAELHVILPVPVDLFKSTSVTPFGAAWGKRFEKCLSVANSITVCNQSDPHWPNKTSAQFSSQTAMGRAVLRANTFFSKCHQILIWDENDTHSSTGADALLWRNSGRDQSIIPYPGNRAKPSSDKAFHDTSKQNLVAVIYIDLADVKALDKAAYKKMVALAKRGAQNANLIEHIDTTLSSGVIFGFANTGHAADFAFTLRTTFAQKAPQFNIHLSGHYAPLNTPFTPDETSFETVKAMVEKIPFGEFYVSETFAATLALLNGHSYIAEYIGTRDLETLSGDKNFRLFHLTSP